MNILMFVCDTLRADHLGCYNYFRKTSPNIDRLAEEGVLFQECFSSGVCTGTAFTSIHTGLYPIHHKVYNICPPTLVLDETPTLAEILRANGFTTVAFDNLAYNRYWSQDPVHFYRGFEYYISDISNPRDWDIDGERVMAEWYTQRMIHWIKNNHDQDFFLFVHPWDVHQPYVLPESYRTIFRHTEGDRSDFKIREAPAGYQYVPGWGKLDEIFEGHSLIPENRSPGSVPRREGSIDLYDGAVAYLDSCIGTVLDFLEKEALLEDTLILVMADHGELLGQHGIYTHDNVYDANTHIPFIMRYPAKLPKGARFGGLVGTIDILPTVLDLCGIDSAGSVDGKSVTGLVKGEKWREAIISEDGGGIRGITKGDWRLIVYYGDGKVELHNRLADPMEVIDLATEKEDKVRELRGDLEAWTATSLDLGAQDPIIPVARDFNRGKLLEKITIKNYVPVSEIDSAR